MKNFTGKYSKEVEEMLVASAVSGVNVMLISPPGFGKTEMALAASEKLCEKDGERVFLGLDPATPPEVVRGAYDPQQLLKTGNLVLNVKGTAYDPEARVIILDEIWRSNDLVFAALIHATSDKMRNPLELPVFWATSNSVGASERVEALRDRFGMWAFLKPKTDVDAIVKSQFDTSAPTWGKSIPSWEECLKIRRENPSKKAISSISSVLTTLGNEAMANQMPINPRRITQWSEILARLSIFETGTSDFEQCSNIARNALRWAYPCVNQEMYDKWQKIVAVVTTDQVGEAIESFRGLAKQKFDKIVQSTTNKADLLMELGRSMGEAQTEIKKIGGSDPRVETVLKELNQIFQTATKDVVNK